MRILLDDSKKFYKANLHCHSTNSDGKMTVQQLKKEFLKHGYSVIAFTDHEHVIDNSFLDDENFLTITSCEIAIKEFETESTLNSYNMRVCHLNLYSENQHNTFTPCYNSVYDHFKNPSIEGKIMFNCEYKRIYSIQGINDIIKSANEQGFFVSYNHPNWSLENAIQYLQYKGLFAVEIYNTKCDVQGGTENNIHVLDDFLRDGQKIYCTMCDDCHERNGADGPGSDMFGGWVMINSDKLTYNSIISSLKSGNFYSSQGPNIFSLTIDNDIVRVQTSNVKRISYSTRGRRTNAINANVGSFINEAYFKTDKTDGYFRITVVDEFGKYAYSQAYYL